MFQVYFHFISRESGGKGGGRLPEKWNIVLMVVQYTDDRTVLYHEQDSGILACEILATNKLRNKVTGFLLLSNTLAIFVSRNPKDM